jgi:predicted dehydrogenase
MKRLNVGLVGAGFMGKAHVEYCGQKEPLKRSLEPLNA